ncbi:MAG: EAL and HDOD domain-containing protein [Terracidiphilus sp.]
MPLVEFSTEDEKPARFAARMPVLSASDKVFGYKLLFRNDFNNYFPSIEGDVASRGVIDMSSLIGLSTLSNNLPAFIVTTHDTLVGEYLALLPPQKVIAEIPDSVSMDSDVAQACWQLKENGYKIAFSNFRSPDPREEFEGIADFVKIDIKMLPLNDVARLTRRFGKSGVQLIAEKVETREDFEFCKSVGFNLFEGYFFRKPEVMRARGVQSNRMVYLRLLSAISKPSLDWSQLEEIVKSDPMIYFRLLRYLNSAIFGLRSEVKTISQALTILGEDEIRRWCRLTGMLELSKNKPSDLALAALVRARFAESLSDTAGSSGSDMFLVGLLSLMDAILEIPMRDVLEGLPLDENARAVLLENEGPLSPLYELMLAVEAGHWPKIVNLSWEIGVDQDLVARSQWSAMEWAHSIVSAG